jgi:hypothetical protein
VIINNFNVFWTVIRQNTGKTASTKVLKALAQALGVEMDELV